jgi:AcrR family transcriptional regulator
MKTPLLTSRRHERSETTRVRLLRAAEKIFARDGFEAAKLEEIASQAGYTRGALYANFESKEDLFLALLEDEISSRIDNVESSMQAVRQPADKLRVIREVFLTMSGDRRWCLLSLEFKLFAMRHPEVKARLTALNRRLIKARVGVLQETLEATRSRSPVSPGAIAMSLSAVTNALVLEHMLDHKIMPEGELRTLLASYFDSVTLPANHHPSPLRAGKKLLRQPAE